MAEKPDSLFLVGNGFDIAHGIPSGYNEFRKDIQKRLNFGMKGYIWKIWTI